MNKVLGTLGMAMRANKLGTGDAVIEDVRNKNAKLIVIAEDASDNTKKKIIDKCQFYGVDYVFIESGAVLSHAIGKTNRMAVSVKEEGFAKKIKTCLTKG